MYFISSAKTMASNKMLINMVSTKNSKANIEISLYDDPNGYRGTHAGVRLILKGIISEMECTKTELLD